MIGIILALVVALFKSLWELAGKVFTNTKSTSSIDEYALSLGTRLISCIALFPIAVFVGIPTVSESMWSLLFISSILWAIATVTALKALKYGELSLVSPLSALTIPFLLITSYFITKESPNIYGYIWVSIIFIGTYFLQLHETKSGLLWPIRAIYHSTWAKYMLITALLWSITSPIDKLWVLEIWALWWMFYHNLGVTIILGLYMILRKKQFSLKKMSSKNAIKKISIISVLGWAMIFLQMLALSYTLVVYVIALKRASWMFSVFLWYIFFQEKHILQKLLAAGIMLVWVWIISILWNI